MPPRFRLGHESLWLVPRRDVLVVDDETRARAVVRELVGDGGSAGAMLRSAGLDLPPGATESDEEAQLVRALVSGRLVLLRDDSMPALGRPSGDLDGPRDPGEPFVPMTTTQSIRITVLDYTGIPYGGLQVEIDFPDGHRETVTLDKHGRFIEEDVAGPGSCRVVFPSKLRLSQEDRRRTPLEGFRPSGQDVEIPRDDARPQSFALGKSHRVVVQAPVAQPSLAFRGAAFAFDSAFPTPGVASMLNALVERVAVARQAGDTRPQFGLFGHCDPSGDVDYNKELSDRRAKAIFSLATGNADLFDEVAEAEDWPLSAYQAMLRGLGNNPGPIDGEMGPMTKEAIAAFREEYGEDAHFDSSVRELPRRHGPLDPGDKLDDATKAAIRDAYHAEYCIALKPEDFLGPKMSGCSEFNLVSDDKGDNRRVTLAVWGDDAPKADEFPCQAGQAGACTVDDGGMLRCRFYREHVRDPDEVARDVVFWDGEWRRSPGGVAHLSALTTHRDGTDVEFNVQIATTSKAADVSGSGAPPPDHGPSVDVLQGEIRNGIAFARWVPTDGYEPFDFDEWFRVPGRPRDPWLPRVQPPVFTVAAGPDWLAGVTPGHRVARSLVRGAAGPLLIVRADGTVVFTDEPSDVADDAASGQRAIAVWPRAGHRRVVEE